MLVIMPMIVVTLCMPLKFFRHYFTWFSLPLSPITFPLLPLAIMKSIPTQRTTTTITTLKPPEQTTRMKAVLTSRTPLTRQLLRPINNTITNRTLRLPLHSSAHILPPRNQSIDQRIPLACAAGAEVHDALRDHEPRLPFLFHHADAVDGFYFGAGEGIGGREAD